MNGIVAYVSAFVAICAGLVTILTVYEKLSNVKKVVSAPNTEQNQRLDALEARCDRYDRFFDADKQRIADLEQMLSVLMQSQFALLSHAINGNDVDKLKKAQEDMLEYLTKRGISV